MREKLKRAARGAIILAVVFAAGFFLYDIIGSGPEANPERWTVKIVNALAETEAAGEDGGAADDAAVWIAADPARSLIFGTDPEAGLYAYGLDGARHTFLPAGSLANIDLRDGFEFAGRRYVLVAATDRSDKTAALFLLDPETEAILRPFGGAIPLDFKDAYGLCLYRSTDGRYYVIATGQDGRVRQFIVRPAPGGGVTAERVRAFKLDSLAEGCVADDRTGRLYIAEKTRGIWRYGAEPGSGSKRKLIAKADGRALTRNVEGLALYPRGERRGYLIASSQGDSTFAVFNLPREYLAGRFQIGASADGTVDAVTGTDGIAVTAAALSDFPEGFLIVQDGEDDSGRQNFKVVDWRDVKTALELE